MNHLCKLQIFEAYMNLTIELPSRQQLFRSKYFVPFLKKDSHFRKISQKVRPYMKLGTCIEIFL
jgi:hypothetical protein